MKLDLEDPINVSLCDDHDLERQHQTHVDGRDIHERNMNKITAYVLHDALFLKNVQSIN